MPSPLILLVACAQGLLYYLIYRQFELDAWPSQDSVIFMPLLVLITVWPAGFVFSIGSAPLRSVLLKTSAATFLLVPFSAYVGWQITPFADIRAEAIIASHVASMLVAAFALLLLLEAWLTKAPLQYPALLAASWRNIIIAAMTAGLCGALAIVLSLWSVLFEVIGITFFRTLFSHELFISVFGASAVATGVTAMRGLSSVIESIPRLAASLSRLLLPIAVVIELTFISALPFTGLEPLWATGNGTALLLALMAIILLGTVVSESQSGHPEGGAIMRGLILAGLLTLPILSVLSFYGLSLRVEQYGWTVERCWAMTLWALLSAFALGFAFGIIRLQLRWRSWAAKVNLYGLFAVLTLALITNSPLLDFRKLSLASQIKRIEHQDSDWRRFDFFYAQVALGRPGWRFTNDLINDLGKTDPDLAEYIRHPPYRSTPSYLDWEQQLVRTPADLAIPQGVLSRLQTLAQPGVRQHVFEVQLRFDGAPSYVVMSEMRSDFVTLSLVDQASTGEWRVRNMRSEAGEVPNLATLEAMNAGAAGIDYPTYQALSIDGVKFEVF